MSGIPIWRIRPAGPDDADALSVVGAATFLEAYCGVLDGNAIVVHCVNQHSPDTYRRYLANGAKAWLVEIEPGGAPVGYALSCKPELELAEENDLELKRIYLLAQFQGSPMSAALLRSVVSSASGHCRLLLGVKEDNLRALAFYRKHGFETVGSRRFNVGGKMYDDFVLALPLSA